MIPQRRWSPDNHAAVTSFLDSLQGRAGPLTAAFDWDETCIFRCLGTASFRLAIDRLELRFSPDALAELLRGWSGDVAVSAQGVSFEALYDDIVEDWSAVWPMVRDGRHDDARAAHPVTWRDLRARLGFLYDAYEFTEGLGPPVAYPYLVELLAGRTEAELEDLARRAWAMACAEVPEDRAWTSQAGRSPAVTWAWTSGMKLNVEMLDLARALDAAGVQVWVITASGEAFIRAGVQITGFPAPMERVVGIRLQRDASGVTLPKCPPFDTHPLTWRAGKAETIRRLLPAPPVFTAGDTNTDVEMLTAFPETELRLVVYRGSRGAIERVYAHARGEGTLSGRTLLQGRDEVQGGFAPRVV
ncbi:MAG: haloacid dehalogenase-like hydrolase [Alphaproteobacteria bacterium]|nr:haloacid dehalogenase-like hydrolase [Alphaproteobacteria bacterium]